MHFLTSKQVESAKQLNSLFKTAFEFSLSSPKKSLKNRILAIVKDEASTRTRVSFETAMKRLGGEVVIVELDKSTSVAKGESLRDTLITLGQYVDAIVMRYSIKGMVSKCAEVSPVPIINAGDGDGEHPTQALLDAFTIQQECERLNNLNIMFAGDLKYSRTVHSLIHLLSLYPKNKFTFVSPENLQLPSEYIPKNHVFHEETDLSDALSKNKVDVLYMTRFQRERYPKEGVILNPKKLWILTENDINNLSKDCKVLHPLPRGEEIPVSFDLDERAAYFRQVKNGMYIRMVLLYNLLVKGDYFA